MLKPIDRASDEEGLSMWPALCWRTWDTPAFRGEVNSVKKVGSAHYIFVVQTQHQTIKRSCSFPLLVNLIHMQLFDKGMD